MGEVWQGTDLVLDRKVAVKLLRPEHAEDSGLLARFRAEARLTGLLSHPNIAQVYDFREAASPEPAYLVMEFVEGRSLARLLDDGPLAPAQAMDIVAQAARGLAAAHRAGLVHRDIKPGNLLVRDDGLVKVTDFGIARAESATPLTQTGQLPGTPGYMAPERATGAPATPAADLYSLGIVAHQCLTGRPPFMGDFLAVTIAHMERPMPPLPASVPDAVAALVADLTRKDPRERPLSAQEVAAEAERARVLSAQAQPAAPPAADPEQAAAASTMPDEAAGLSPAAATRTDLPLDADRATDGVRLLQPGTWQLLRRVRGIGRLAGRLPGVGRVPWLPARAGLGALAVAALGAAGLVGWMLGTMRPATTGQPAQPPSATRPGHQASSAVPTLSPGPAPAATRSAQPTASPTASPTPTPSATPTPSPTPTVSPSPSSSASPSPTVTPTSASGSASYVR
jgi:serine/threonine-protein kinase